jgi:histidine triad (HIT) family protein
MDNCTFCKIIEGKIPAKIVYEDSDLVVFPDIQPKEKVHLLIVPREHIENFLDLQEDNIKLLTKIIKVIQQLVKDKKLESSYRVVVNGGVHQEIPHLHFHLLAD